MDWEKTTWLSELRKCSIKKKGARGVQKALSFQRQGGKSTFGCWMQLEGREEGLPSK